MHCNNALRAGLYIMFPDFQKNNTVLSDRLQSPEHTLRANLKVAG